MCVTGSLKRSLSDRRPASAVVKCGSDVLEMSTSPPNSFLFSDTMALRSRAARHDTRELFLDQLDDRIKSSIKIRPREPPPPPPPEPEHTNLITYQEFSKMIDEGNQNENSTPKNRNSNSHRVVFDTIPLAPVKLCNNCESGMVKPNDEGKTVVKITQTSENEPSKRTSIIITGNVPVEDKSSNKRTSVIMNNFPEDCNKVTISVRNQDEASPSCSTIIETGSQSQSTVIPVVSTDNRTMLVVGETIPNVETPVKASPAPYLFSSTTLLDNMDPVEAVRRNLVPHVCGKEETTPPSLVERLKEKRSPGVRKVSNILTSTPGEEPRVSGPDSLLLAFQARKLGLGAPPWATPEDSSTPTSRSSSFSMKTSSRNTSRSNSFNGCSHNLSKTRSKFYVASDSDDTVTQELDKLDDEYIIRNGLKRDIDNIYEVIKEPIYDTVGPKIKAEESDDDVPPPLPTSLPPSLEDLENRTSKSIFEGASKYDILSYLVDAKDRVHEDLFLDNRRSDELVDHRRMESLDGSEISTGKASDSGVDAGPASTSSDSSEDRDSLLLGRKSSAEIERNDSGVGSEASHSSRSKWQSNSTSLKEDPIHLCEDCDETVETQVTDRYE